MITRFRVVSLLVLAGATVMPAKSKAQRGAQAPRVPTMAARSPVYAPNGVVATSQPLATSAGLRVLENGGNAIDAAVTAAAVLSVTEPNMTGIGGDMFAIIWLAKEKRLVALNASGRAGSLMTREELVKRGRNNISGVESITVPGALAGWQELLSKYGTLTLAKAIEPAIGYAENGFVLTPIIARNWAGQAGRLRRDSGGRTTFLKDTMPPRAGEWFSNPDYARTLKQIAREGPAAMYGGSLGKRMTDYLRSIGGFITLEDMRANKPDWVTPISANFKGYRVWQMPPNNQGIAVLEMLRILEPIDLKSMGHNTAPYLHHLIEAKKLAHADLARYVGDPDHLTVPTSYLLSDPFINERRSRIDPNKAQQRMEPGPERTAGETIYLTTADKDGNMVSFINSVFNYFGSGIVVPGTGFAMHDRGSGFTMTQGLPNTVAPGKRPFHTLIPGFVTKPGRNASPDGAGDEPWMSFGLMGGAMQAQGHVQFLLNMIVFDMDVQAAQDAARFRHMSGLGVIVEDAMPESVMGALRLLGHEVTVSRPSEFGGSQAIVKLLRGYVGGSDPRKDGHAAGY